MLRTIQMSKNSKDINNFSRDQRYKNVDSNHLLKAKEAKQGVT